MIRQIYTLLLAASCGIGTAHAAHGLSMYDSPKYPPGFTHFDYVNPDAPQGGTLYLANPDRRTSFDKFNPFSMKGVAAAGVGMLMFETLATGSADEVAAMYGLLADDMQLAPDRRSITFHINPAARFNNGDPVTASDVRYSFETLMTKGAPQFKVVFGEIVRCEVIDRQTVRFYFASDNKELPLLAGSIPVFSPKWAEGTPFDQIQLVPPVASGPYLIDQYDVGRQISFRRNPDYWGSKLPVRRGTYNFTRIVYRFYKDNVARLEAFKAGEFDVSVEYSAKNWVRGYTGPRFDKGEIIRKELPHMNGAGMQGFVMNLRRPQFRDVRVRQALILALDYEWLNRQLFYNQYKRLDSYFTNTELAAHGKPEGDELALLTSLRQHGLKIDDAVFGAAPLQPNTNPPGSLRENLLKARALLKEAGWTYRDGALRNARGEPFRFEIVDDGGAMSRVASAYVRNLEKLGIQVEQRTADYALLAKRMDQFDFDMTSMRFGDSNSPGNELFDMMGSASASVHGSSNYWGLADPAVDALIKRLVAAQTRAQQVTAARALDRILLHKYLTVPHWYSATHRVAYDKRLGMPSVLPKYYQADPVVISTWWEKTPK